MTSTLAETCPSCDRTAKFWEGCAHVDCPKRQHRTRDLQDTTAALEGYEVLTEGCYRHKPTTED